MRSEKRWVKESVNQIVIHGYVVAKVSQRLGISTESLYVWIKRFNKSRQQRNPSPAIKGGVRTLDSRTMKFDKSVGSRFEHRAAMARRVEGRSSEQSLSL